MNGKIALVTGATDGIGKVTALELARRGANVVGVGRNAQKCAQVSEQIQRVTGNSNVEFLVHDLSVQASVRELASAFKRKHSQLDVLVNNAGAYFATRKESADGIEMTWALNHLNYFLLTNELLEILKSSASARVVNVSSDAHRAAKIRLNDPEFQRGFGQGWGPYAHSKLANVMFTYELAQRLNGTRVTVNAVHPGFVATKFGHNNSGIVHTGITLIQKLIARTPEKGAETNIFLATSPTVEHVTGCYFMDKKAISSSRVSYDKTQWAQLWDLSEQMIKPAATM